jgi:hypothetical protein
MTAPSLRRWARLGIPLAMLVVGLAFRLSGVLPGWATLLILGGIISGALVAYVILLGDHDRSLVMDRATEEAKVAEFNVYGRFRGERGSGYDGR